MTIDQIQNDIVDEFSEVDDWMDRYAMIIDLGNNLPEIDEKYKTPDHLIEGCQSRVWLTPISHQKGRSTIRLIPTR